MAANMDITKNPLVHTELTIQGYSDPDDLIHFLDDHHEDILFLLVTIRTSKIKYTSYQKELIKQLEQEYENMSSNSIEFQPSVFEDIVIKLREDLIPRETLDPEYCEEQRNFYNCVYSAFARSSFPYSDRQKQLLKEIKEDLKWATGNLSDMRDMGILDDFQGFLDLMKDRDHVNNTTFYVNCAVEYHVQEIIEELYYPAFNERNLSIPADFLDEPKVLLANYATAELKSVYRGVHFNSYENIFHLGMAEIYNHLINIFRYSGLCLSVHQRELLTGILGDVGKTVRSPTIENYASLQLGFYGFMDALRRDHQERELKSKDGYKVINEDEEVARAVARIIKEFDDLQAAAEIHHMNFQDYSSSIPDVTKPLFHHFLCFYPREIKETITIELGKRFRAPALYDIGCNRARKF